MDNSQFNVDSMTGRLVKIHSPTSPDVAWAFAPYPLPPSWNWPTDLWPLLLEARTCLADLNGTGKHLPNPEILLQPLQGREAQLSSKLEGTITDPKQQVLFQADPKLQASASENANAFREVSNYRRALRLRTESPLPLSLRLIKELHAVLMMGVRGSDQQPGEFRTVQNQIDSPARYVPPPVGQMNEALDAFEKYLHFEGGFDPLVRAFLTHYQFEAIHPFRDGNGRVGRLLLSRTIADWCNLSNQWLYMSPYFEKKRKEYMDLMLAVSTDGAWGPWIKFCLEGTILQALDTRKRCDKLLALHKDFRSRLKGGSVRLSTFVDKLFSSPVITVADYKRTFKVTYPTARSDLRKLETLEIVQELPIGSAGQLAYYCLPIYRVTYEEIE
jgi:Fic family protein